MSISKAKGDVSNTAVRAFLCKATDHYSSQGNFDPGTKKNKELWKMIVKKYFNDKCFYCGISKADLRRKGKKLEREHLISMNQFECGLNVLGNIVPCCHECNTRRDKIDAKGKGDCIDWKTHLKERAKKKGYIDGYNNGKQLVKRYRKDYPYPKSYNINKMKEIVKVLYEKANIPVYAACKKAGFPINKEDKKEND